MCMHKGTNVKDIAKNILVPSAMRLDVMGSAVNEELMIMISDIPHPALHS